MPAFEDGTPSELLLDDCAFDGNHSESGAPGAAVEFTGDLLRVTNSTFANNFKTGVSGSPTGGVHVPYFNSNPLTWEAWVSGIVEISNSICWGNEGDAGTNTGESAALAFDPEIDCTLTNNLIQGLDRLACSSCTSSDPQFVSYTPLPDCCDPPPTNNDYHLQSTSPAIDGGDNNLVQSETDLDGNPRIYDGLCGNNGQGTVDMGAYEAITAGDGNVRLKLEDRALAGMTGETRGVTVKFVECAEPVDLTFSKDYQVEFNDGIGYVCVDEDEPGFLSGWDAISAHHASSLRRTRLRADGLDPYVGFTWPDYSLRAGNIIYPENDPGGGAIDLGDFVQFASCFGLTSTNSGCDAGALDGSDLNQDGTIDLSDFVLFAGNFGLGSHLDPEDLCPIPAPPPPAYDVAPPIIAPDSWESCQDHGGTEYCLPLAVLPADVAGQCEEFIETRSRNLLIRPQFSEEVTMPAADKVKLTCRGGCAPVSPDSRDFVDGEDTGTILELTFINVPNAKGYEIKIVKNGVQDTAGHELTGDNDVLMILQIGNVDPTLSGGWQKTDSADCTLIQTTYEACPDNVCPVDADNYLMDLDLDGDVDVADRDICNNNFSRYALCGCGM